MHHLQNPELALVRREPIVSAKVCAAHFGVCSAHLRRLAHDGIVPYIRTSSPGKRVHFRFRIADVEKALEVKKTA